MTPEAIGVGIDVSTAVLDSAAHPTGERWQVPNTPEGIGELVSRLHELAPERIVLEATGGLEVPAVAALGSAGLPVVAVNRARRGTALERRAAWPRRTRWTHGSRLTSRRWSGQPYGHCPMQQRAGWAR